MIWLWDNAMTLSTLVMAAAAIVALIYAHLQIAENPHFQKSGYLDQYTQRFQTFLWGALSDPRQTPPPPNVARIDEPNRKASNRA